MTTSVRRIIPLTVGWERLPKSFSVHGDTSGEMLVEPVGAVLLDTDDGPALIDTGMNSVLIRDPALFARMHGRNHSITPILPDTDGEPLEDALAEHGVALGDVTRIFLSHLHNDHAGGLRLFPGVPVWVQRAEYDYGMADHPFPERHGMFRIDYDDPDIDWRWVYGDTELAPGIRAVSTPGHTPGHQSFVVDLPDGTGCAFACDAADLLENVERGIGPGGFVHCAPEVPRDSLLRLKAVAAAHGYPVVPWHCPTGWPAFTKQMLG